MALNRQEVRFLAEHAAAIDAVRSQLGGSKNSQLRDAQLLADTFGEYGRCVAELVAAQSNGKLPEGWLADHDAAQQATAGAVAEARWSRLAELGVTHVWDVTCSVGSEGARVPGGVDYVGSDIDASRVLMARHNLGVPIVQADATRPPLRPEATDRVILADPARRAGGRRITRTEDVMPPIPELLAAHRGRELAIKCAPGIDYSEWDGSAVVTSLDGGVKETCLYTPGLGGAGRREAIVLRGSRVDSLSSDDPDAPGEELVTNPEPGMYVIDPDGAIVRAGLVRQFAVREGLGMLDPRIAYLVGRRVPRGYSGFPMLATVPVKGLKRELAARDCGSVEILVRGLGVDPDRLRKKLKLRGNMALAVVLTRIGRQGVAVVCGPREFSVD